MRDIFDQSSAKREVIDPDILDALSADMARTASLEVAWGRKMVAKTFEESVEGKKFKNPETGRQVMFKSLPSDEQAKIRAQWDGGHGEGAVAAARETASRIVDGIDRPKGWRSSGDEPSLTEENRKAWEAEHSAKTPGGSVLLGTTHMDSEDPTTGAMSHADPTAQASFKEHVINGAVDAAKAAAKAGKKVVVLSEGTTYGDDTLDDPNDWNEQHAVAKAVHEATGGKAVQDTWDDDTVSLTNPESDVWKRMTSAAGGDPVKAKGALAVFMAGQGQSWDSMVEDGWADDDVAEAVRKATGTDPRGRLSNKTQQRFYDMAFPGDSGKPHTEVSAIGEVYNAARQENLLRKIREVEADGGVVIAAPGASHAYNLKGAIEGRGKTSSDLDLEMAWGWNARVAAKISEILNGLSPKVVSGAKSVTPRLKRADPNNAMWTYSVPGSKGETYTVRVKGVPKGNLRAVSKMDVLVSCSCPFFRYQGPEHWAKVGDYLYGKPVGTATKPDQKDPDGRNRVCKHVAAVFDRADSFFYTPPKGKTASYVVVRQFFPGVSLPLFHATTGPRAGQIAFRGQGIRAESGFSDFGGQAGISFSRDLSFLLAGGFGRYIFVVDAAEVGRRYSIEPVQHPSAPDEREERVYALVIPTGMIRGLIVNDRPLPFEVAELATLPFPVVHRDRAGAWVSAVGR